MSRPDDWRFHVNDLINQGTDGRDSVRSGLKELEMAGYLKRLKIHGSDGKFLDDEWILYEEPMDLKEKVPQTGFPAPAKPTTENPALGNRPLLSTEEKLSTENTTTTTQKPSSIEEKASEPAVVVDISQMKKMLDAKLTKIKRIQGDQTSWEIKYNLKLLPLKTFKNLFDEYGIHAMVSLCEEVVSTLENYDRGVGDGIKTLSGWCVNYCKINFDVLGDK